MDDSANEGPWSVTTLELRTTMRRRRAAGADAVVATVADVEGSAYRRPGAKMLVDADGAPLGAVTAGCLEGPVTELSMDVLDGKGSRVERFDLTEDDGTWGLGLGCNGIIDLLLEPLDAGWDGALDRLADGESVTMVAVVETDGTVPVGARSLVGDDGETEPAGEREPVPAAAIEAADDTVRRVHGTGDAATVSVETGDGTLTALVDGLAPVPRLLLFGSERDINPVCRLASTAGFEVVVHSARGARDEASFPHADQVRTGHPSTVADSVSTPGETYAVVMSHNFMDDQIAVETLLTETAVPYIGLMGPRDRFDQLREESDTIDASTADRIATPVGLDLGGGEPIEIAFSIVSEVLAVSNGRAGGRLETQAGPVHKRIEE
jgi:xanthine dehydrogenase accessory factor